jgi:hypothetical protein
MSLELFIVSAQKISEIAQLYILFAALIMSTLSYDRIIWQRRIFKFVFIVGLCRYLAKLY